MDRLANTAEGIPVRTAACHACGSEQLSSFLELPSLPIHCNRLWSSRGAAVGAPRGDFRLVACGACGHVENAAFDPSLLDYRGNYENSLHFSPHFQKYVRHLAEYLIDRYYLRGRRILEIGCGKGEFLRLLTHLGGNRGIGFDPSWQPLSEQESADICFVPALFLPEEAANQQVDFVCCRQVLEHIPDPFGFLSGLRQALGGRPVPVFFEVPNAAHIFRQVGIWDLIYEHPSYFTPRSLARCFTAAGFRVTSVREAFAGQYLWLEAYADGTPRVLRPMRTAARWLQEFPPAAAARIEHWRRFLAGLGARRAVVWGAGSKGVMFLNLVAGAERIPWAVDLNPRKHGHYLPGCGIEVVAPERLVDLPPDLVLVMNPVYGPEIRLHLERLGLAPLLQTA